MRLEAPSWPQEEIVDVWCHSRKDSSWSRLYICHSCSWRDGICSRYPQLFSRSLLFQFELLVFVVIASQIFLCNSSPLLHASCFLVYFGFDISQAFLLFSPSSHFLFVELIIDPLFFQHPPLILCLLKIKAVRSAGRCVLCRETGGSSF